MKTSQFEECSEAVLDAASATERLLLADFSDGVKSQNIEFKSNWRDKAGKLQLFMPYRPKGKK